MRPDGVICIKAKLAEPLLERCRPTLAGRRRPQDRQPVTDRHVVLTILRIQNGVLIYLPYQVPSMKPVFVILQAYSSLSVPELA
jgi:hypothetical protein